MRYIASGILLFAVCLLCSGCAFPHNGGGYGASDHPYIGRVEPKDEPFFDPIGCVVDHWSDKQAVKQYKQQGYSDERARQRVFEDDFFNRK